MARLALEDFAPQPVARKREREEHTALLRKVEEAAYEQGFRAGSAAAEEAFSEEQAHLATQVVEALNDAQITHEEARLAVVRTVRGLATTIAESVTTAALRETLPGRVADHVARVLEDAPRARLVVTCAPQFVAAVEAVCAEKLSNVRIEGSEQVATFEARLHWEEGFDQIDLGEFRESLIRAVEECFVLLEEKERHGERTA